MSNLQKADLRERRCRSYGCDDACCILQVIVLAKKIALLHLNRTSESVQKEEEEKQRENWGIMRDEKTGQEEEEEAKIEELPPRHSSILPL